MNGRVYDPWLGRFLSPDPFVQSPGNSQSYNRYSYCLNNPLKYIDPSGYTNHPKWWDPAEAVCWEAYAWLNTTGTSGGSAQMNRGPSLSDIVNYNTYCAYYNGDPGQMASFSQYYYDGYYSSLFGMKSDYPHQFNNVISREPKSTKKGTLTSPAPAVNGKEWLADLLGHEQLTSEILCLIFHQSFKEYLFNFLNKLVLYEGPENIDDIAEWLIETSVLYPDERYLAQFPEFQNSTAIISYLVILTPLDNSLHSFGETPTGPFVPLSDKPYYFSYQNFSTLNPSLHYNPIPLSINGNTYEFTMRWVVPFFYAYKF